MTPFPSADIEMNVEDDGSYAIEHDDNILVSEEDHCSMLSESTTVSSHGHKAGQRYDNDESDTPEKLVRRENRAIRISRIGAILILVVATVTTSLLIHGFMSKSEEEAFNSNFKMVSGKIVESMKADATLKFWMARSLANTVTLALDKGASTATNLTLPPTIWERITQEARFTGNGNLVAWSPLLLTESARQDFEAFSATQEFTIGANPVCFVCGAELRGYSNPGDMVELTGFGSYPCSQIENSGRLGIIPEENCEAISLASSASCRCADLPNDSVVVDNKMVVPAEIFQVDENSGNVVTVPSESGPYSPLWQTTVLEINQMPLMYDQMTDPVRARAIRNMKDTLMPVVSEIFKREGPYYEKYGAYLGETSSILYYPVFDPSDELLIGSITIEMLWKTFMTGVFPPNRYVAAGNNMYCFCRDCSYTNCRRLTPTS